jgi:hypothetical protein
MSATVTTSLPLFLVAMMDNQADKRKSGREGIQTQNGPHAILLSDVSRAGSKALFTTNKSLRTTKSEHSFCNHDIPFGLVLVHQVSKELPASRHLIEREIQLLGDTSKINTISQTRLTDPKHHWWA